MPVSVSSRHDTDADPQCSPYKNQDRQGRSYGKRLAMQCLARVVSRRSSFTAAAECCAAQAQRRFVSTGDGAAKGYAKRRLARHLRKSKRMESESLEQMRGDDRPTKDAAKKAPQNAPLLMWTPWTWRPVLRGCLIGDIIASTFFS